MRKIFGLRFFFVFFFHFSLNQAFSHFSLFNFFLLLFSFVICLLGVFRLCQWLRWIQRVRKATGLKRNMWKTAMEHWLILTWLTPLSFGSLSCPFPMLVCSLCLWFVCLFVSSELNLNYYYQLNGKKKNTKDWYHHHHHCKSENQVTYQAKLKVKLKIRTCLNIPLAC